MVPRILSLALTHLQLPIFHHRLPQRHPQPVQQLLQRTALVELRVLATRQDPSRLQRAGLVVHDHVRDELAL
jgi:hypothetical protein